MAQNQTVYLANMGMITAIGINAQMTAASAKAGISRYQLSEYTTHNHTPVTMAGVPDIFFETFPDTIDEGEYYSSMYDHIIKMAITAIREALAGELIDKPIPLLLALPEPLPHIKQLPVSALAKNLFLQKDILIQQQIRAFHSGRTGGIQAIEMAGRYLYEQNEDFVLVGGSDSYWHLPLIKDLSKYDRLLTHTGVGGFVPGEAAGFLLLTKNKEHALKVDNHAIAVLPPGVADEPGYMHSNEVYTGEGLDRAVKLAINTVPDRQIGKIYSSMNGEQFWSKELGVSMIRNSRFFKENIEVEHPADCYGDIGAATGSVLIGLAATDLLKNTGSAYYLVQCSSDGAWRAAITLKKEYIHENQ